MQTGCSYLGGDNAEAVHIPPHTLTHTLSHTHISTCSITPLSLCSQSVFPRTPAPPVLVHQCLSAQTEGWGGGGGNE